MNLVTRFLAARRDKLLMKAGCWLVCFSLVLGLMLPQQRAEAVVAELTMTAVASVAAAYLCACGLPLVTQGMDEDALVSSVQRLIQEFLNTELGGISIQDWLVGVWDFVFTGGKLVLSRMLTDKFMEFAQWVAGKYGTQVGVNAVYESSGYYFSTGELLTGGMRKGYSHYLDFSTVSRFYVGQTYIINGHSVSYTSDLSFCIDDVVLYTDVGGSRAAFLVLFPSRTLPDSFATIYNSDVVYWVYPADPAGIYDTVSTLSSPSFSLSKHLGSVTDESLSIDREEETPVYIPPGIEAEQGIALDVGAAATMDLDQVLQGVLDGVLEGTLTATMEAAGEAVENPPATGEIADVDNLGLPALGQALTSRFPFSIPWDFFRAVQLLAAPAKAPYFEVDFMEPLADEVGGWQGSTKVVLDFSEYAIIGQISRWTSTIGFCLMLAGATKRLIWTA